MYRLPHDLGQKTLDYVNGRGDGSDIDPDITSTLEYAIFLVEHLSDMGWWDKVTSDRVADTISMAGYSSIMAVRLARNVEVAMTVYSLIDQCALDAERLQYKAESVLLATILQADDIYQLSEYPTTAKINLQLLSRDITVYEMMVLDGIDYTVGKIRDFSRNRYAQNIRDKAL